MVKSGVCLKDETIPLNLDSSRSPGRGRMSGLKLAAEVKPKAGNTEKGERVSELARNFATDSRIIPSVRCGDRSGWFPERAVANGVGQVSGCRV